RGRPRIRWDLDGRGAGVGARRATMCRDRDASVRERRGHATSQRRLGAPPERRRQEMFPLAEPHLGDELTDLGAKLQARKIELTGSRLQRAKRAVKKAVRKAA